MAEMKKVPCKCRSCGVEFELYHDGISHTTISIVCHCGERTDWTFYPPFPPGYRGWGMAMRLPDTMKED